MKTLVLVRHGRASQHMTRLPDADKPLDEKGYDEAYFMSTKPAIITLMPQLIIASPAIRAFTTALIFARNLKYPAGKLIIDDRVYNASDEALLDVIHSIPDENDRVFIFGHNPSMTRIANLLCTHFTDHVPTCGICCMDFAMASWSDIRSKAGKLRFFDHP